MFTIRVYLLGIKKYLAAFRNCTCSRDNDVLSEKGKRSGRGSHLTHTHQPGFILIGATCTNLNLKGTNFKSGTKKILEQKIVLEPRSQELPRSRKSINRLTFNSFLP